VGTPQTVTNTWGDTLGVDDSTWITLEVRHLSGEACGASDQWTLTVAGHNLLDWAMEVRDAKGNVTRVTMSYPRDAVHQYLRYGAMWTK